MANKLFTNADYDALLKDVRIANQRISRLTNEFGERSWATNQLYNRLEDPKILALTKTGYVKVNRSMSEVKLKYIQQAVKAFISPETQTSTVRGAKKAISNTQQAIKEHFTRIKRDRKTGEDIKIEISDEQAGRLYNIVKDRDLRDMSEQFNPSEVWARLVRAKEQNKSFDEFAKLFEEDAKEFTKDGIKDRDVQEYLKEIYKMYME